MLQNKFDKYLTLLSTVQDRHGFIESRECDSIMFTSLLGCLPEVNNINIYAAFDKSTGMWHRRPTERPCFDCEAKTEQGSKSTISRDMLLSIAWYAYHNKRLDISEQVIRYAMTHWGFMGCAASTKVLWGRCQIMPSLFATFCWISYKLGGPSRAWARWIPADVGGRVDDFQAHLQVLHILLRRQVSGKLTKTEEASLNYHASRQPNNPLFLHAVGRDLEALEVLKRVDLWPADRLPRKSDRKTQWIPQRDEGDDWKPQIGLPDLIPHSGADFLFLYWLICRKYEIKGNS